MGLPSIHIFFRSSSLAFVAKIFLVFWAISFPLHATEAQASGNCVFHDLEPQEHCPALASGRAFEILSMGEEALIFIEDDGSQVPTKRSVLASARIEDSVLLDEIDEDTAMLLEREIIELSGARYELPRSRSELKQLVGFPENADVASEDWVEMIRVHAEMTLSLSKTASQFLLEQLGLASPPSAPASSPEIEPKTEPEIVPDTAVGASEVVLNPAVVEAD